MNRLSDIAMLAVHARCQVCRHIGDPIQVADLIAHFGQDAALDALLPRFRCSRCRARGRVEITLSWAGGPDDPLGRAYSGIGSRV